MLIPCSSTLLPHTTAHSFPQRRVRNLSCPPTSQHTPALTSISKGRGGMGVEGLVCGFCGFLLRVTGGFPCTHRPTGRQEGYSTIHSPSRPVSERAQFLLVFSTLTGAGLLSFIIFFMYVVKVKNRCGRPFYFSLLCVGEGDDMHRWVAYFGPISG